VNLKTGAKMWCCNRLWHLKPGPRATTRLYRTRKAMILDCPQVTKVTWTEEAERIFVLDEQPQEADASI
jgi:hypothetical protein